MRVSAQARRERLAGLGAAPARQPGTPRADYRITDPGRFPRGRRRKAYAAVQRIAARRAKAATGRAVYTLHHPGAAGHERCRDVCVTYG